MGDGAARVPAGVRKWGASGEPEPFERLPLPLGGKRGQGLDL